MFIIKADPLLNRLSITINDYFDEEDLKTICYVLDREVSKMGSDFVAALDLRGMRVLEQKWTRYLKRIQITLLAHSASRIAALVDNVILKMQLQRLGNETGSNKITRQFNDEQEWRMFISFPPKQDKHHPPQ
jgi:hypothetical protein